jgi:hypothetical protein
VEADIVSKHVAMCICIFNAVVVLGGTCNGVGGRRVL